MKKYAICLDNTNGYSSWLDCNAVYLIQSEFIANDKLFYSVNYNGKIISAFKTRFIDVPEQIVKSKLFQLLGYTDAT